MRLIPALHEAETIMSDARISTKLARSSFHDVVYCLLQ